MREISVSIDYIFGTANIDACKLEIIEKRVKSYMQKDNMLATLNRFTDKNKDAGLSLNVSLNEDKKLECQRMALIRNLITHNNSIVNTVYLNDFRKYKIQGHIYKINDSILPNLESDINSLRSVVRDLARQIKQDLDKDGNLKGMENRNKQYFR